jgi:DNA replication and repair protein RecF
VQVFSVSALNFRSYDLVELHLNKGVTTLVGLNGQGKTNLIEIIDFSANLQSHRASQNTTLIKTGKPFAQTRVGVSEENRKLWLY